MMGMNLIRMDPCFIGLCSDHYRDDKRARPTVLANCDQGGRPEQAIRHKLQRNGEDPDRPLADDFPNYVAAMMFRYLGLKMPECACWGRH
jgi:hypothetical protein